MYVAPALTFLLEPPIRQTRLGLRFGIRLGKAGERDSRPRQQRLGEILLEFTFVLSVVVYISLRISNRVRRFVKTVDSYFLRI
jgi:hypothetical protein